LVLGDVCLALESGYGRFVMACPLSADFVAEVAEEETAVGAELEA
jgi:hypothetical protein